MASLYISQYRETAKVAGNYPVQVGKEPSLKTQKVTYTTSTQSSRFLDGVAFVRVVADADVYLTFGTNPTATASSLFLPANTVEYFGVDTQVSPKVAAYDGSS